MKNIVKAAVVAVGIIACSAKPDGSDSLDGDGSASPQSCFGDKACAASGQLCDIFATVCQGCVVSDDCAGGKVCVGRQCLEKVECTSDKQCAGGVCGSEEHCVDCKADTDCATDQRCLSGSCVGRPKSCTATKDCADRQQVCSSGGCVECGSDADCIDPERPLCNPNGICKAPCGVSEASCVSCKTDSHCPDTTRQFCYSGTCSAPECISGAVECLDKERLKYACDERGIIRWLSCTCITAENRCDVPVVKVCDRVTRTGCDDGYRCLSREEVVSRTANNPDSPTYCIKTSGSCEYPGDWYWAIIAGEEVSMCLIRIGANPTGCNILAPGFEALNGHCVPPEQ